MTSLLPPGAPRKRARAANAAECTPIPRPASEMLRLLACMADGASLETLAALSSKPDNAARVLADAVRGGLFRVNDLRYRFADEAQRLLMYQRLGAAERAGLHLRIGRQLMAQTPQPAPPQALAAILQHLNQGAAGMPMRAERERCAQLNLLAGQDALAAHDAERALLYFSAGLALLDAERWQRHYELCFCLTRHCVACLLALGRDSEANAALGELARRAEGWPDRDAVAALREQWPGNHGAGPSNNLSASA